MYNTSEAYRAAIRAPVRSCTVTGTLGTLALSDSNIQSGTLYIDNQAVSDDNDIGLGACVIGEMGFDLKDSEHIADYYFGRSCKLTYKQLLPNGTYESIPLGEYTVNNNTVRKDRETISIQAYDNMTKFDTPTGFKPYIGGIVDGMRLCCSNAGVKWGGIDPTLANLDLQVSYLPQFTSYTEYITTWRDLLKYLCQLVGGFGTIGRDGKLYVRSLVQKSVPDMVIDTANRKKTSMDDKMLEIGGAQMIVTKYLLDETMLLRYPIKPDGGKLLELPENPCMRFISDKNAVIENIAKNAMKMRYRPMETELFGDPSIDLGDTIRHTGYICGDGETMIVTHCRWQYRGSQTLQAVADMSAGIYIPEIDQTTGTDYVYTIIDSGTAVRLDYYTGTATHLAVPKIVEDKPVTEINATCFTGQSVSRVVIPDGVKIVR